MSRQKTVAELIKKTNETMTEAINSGNGSSAFMESLKLLILEDIALSLAVIADGYLQAEGDEPCQK